MKFGQGDWHQNSGVYAQTYPQLTHNADGSTQALSACAPLQVHLLPLNLKVCC